MNDTAIMRRGGCLASAAADRALTVGPRRAV
jgi:hypothetical protein